MPKPDDYMRMWRPDAGLAPKVTPRSDEPRIIETNHHSSPREVAADVADALGEGDEVIVLGRVDGVRTLICRALPMRRGVFFITKDQRGTGLRPHIGPVMAEAARLVAAGMSRA